MRNPSYNFRAYSLFIPIRMQGSQVMKKLFPCRAPQPEGNLEALKRRLLSQYLAHDIVNDLKLAEFCPAPFFNP